MKQTIIVKNTFIDTDWSWAKDYTTLVLEKEQPYIKDIVKTILDDVQHRKVPQSFLEQQLQTFGIVEEYLSTPDATCEKECDVIRCGWKEKNIFIIEVYSPLNDYRTIYTYTVLVIETDEVFFIPIACYLKGLKYGGTEERLFTKKLFNTYKDAEKWFVNFKKEHPDFTGYEISIMPFDKKSLEDNPWYQIQIKILNYTNGFTDNFKNNFFINSKKMLHELYKKNEHN